MPTAPTHRPSRAPRKSRDVRKPLNMRIKPETRKLLDMAAEATGKNLTDFVLDAARKEAQSALLDRAVIPVSDKAYAAFVALLDATPQPNERLRKAGKHPLAGSNCWSCPRRCCCASITNSKNPTAATLR